MTDAGIKWQTLRRTARTTRITKRLTLQQQLYSDMMHQTELPVSVQTLHGYNNRAPSWPKGSYVTCLSRPALSGSHDGPSSTRSRTRTRRGHRWSTLKKRFRALSVLCYLQTCQRTTDSEWRLRTHKITNRASRTLSSHDNQVWPGWLAVPDNLNFPPLQEARYLIEPFRNTKP